MLLSLCSIETVVVTPQTPEAAKEENCDHHPKLWRDHKGKPVRLTQKQLKQRVIHCETPKLPGTWDANGVVTLQVLIGLEGKVECVKAISGHPLTRRFAQEAAKKWTFKPVTNHNQPVAVSTILMMYVSWDYDKAHRQNCGAK